MNICVPNLNPMPVENWNDDIILNNVRFAECSIAAPTLAIGSKSEDIITIDINSVVICRYF